MILRVYAFHITEMGFNSVGCGFFRRDFLREVPRIATDSWQAPAVTLGYVFHSIKIGKLSKALRSRNYHESYTYLFLVLTICLPMLPFKQDDRLRSSSSAA